MNRHSIRQEKISIEKKLTQYTIRLDKLDATIKYKESVLESTPEYNLEQITILNETITKLKLQSIKLSAEYDLMIRHHREADSWSSKNRKAVDDLTKSKYAENNRSTGSYPNIQSTGLRTS